MDVQFEVVPVQMPSAAAHEFAFSWASTVGPA